MQAFTLLKTREKNVFFRSSVKRRVPLDFFELKVVGGGGDTAGKYYLCKKNKISFMKRLLVIVCVSIISLYADAQLRGPSPGKAVVYFVRVSELGFAINFSQRFWMIISKWFKPCAKAGC